MEQNKYVSALRSLALHALEKSKTGHSGMAMSAMPLTFSLYTKHINIEETNPKWINRDRFVLSGGHGCLSIYTILHFSGLISLDEMKQFRQGPKNVAGHPEYTETNFIDASTGPLGQGVANGVGMAIAEKYLEHRWAKLKGLIDHHTYVVCGDGDLQEGISYEAMSIAGKLKLNKLIMLHDSNDYQLDSDVQKVNNENIKMRVESQNWNYLTCGNNPEEINLCIELAKKSTSRPTFIEVKTIIGEGTTAAASFKAHGFAINGSEIEFANRYYDMQYTDWNWPQDIYNYFKENVIDRGSSKYDEWNKLLNYYLSTNPEEVKQFLAHFDGEFEDYSKLLDITKISTTGDASKTYLKTFFDQLVDTQDIMTLCADVASTTNCKIGNKIFNDGEPAPYVMMGVREFSMAAIQNGILFHKGVKCISGVFLSFADYLKSAMRVGAMCKLPSTYILTHDTYKVGPDGPTHQPYDQLPMLRAISNVYVLRPCDERETFASLKMAFDSKQRTHCLVLTRQGMPSSYNTDIEKFNYGGYVIHEEADADITLIASGSEVELAMNAVKGLKDTFNINAKVVSCPSLKLFLEQEDEYIEETIKSFAGVITIESSSESLWYELSKYTKKVRTIKATKFGKSKDGNILYNDMGFNVENIIEKCQELINEKNF
ncbi:MAG: transketolase [Mycoplasma sp.]